MHMHIGLQSIVLKRYGGHATEGGARHPREASKTHTTRYREPKDGAAPPRGARPP